MRLVDLGNALKAVTPNTSHYKPSKKPDKYIVWAEDGQADAAHGNNQMQIQVLTGTVDYFTKTEFDTVVQQIQAALNELEIGWRLNSVQHEEETGYIHHEWVWTMEVSPDGADDV